MRSGRQQARKHGVGGTATETPIDDVAPDAALRVRGVVAALVGLVDLDGDGYDEVLTSSSGYEYHATALCRLSDDGVQAVELTVHDE